MTEGILIEVTAIDFSHSFDTTIFILIYLVQFRTESYYNLTDPLNQEPLAIKIKRTITCNMWWQLNEWKIDPAMVMCDL